MLGERVLQVWRWYLQRFRRYRKKTRGGARNSPPPPVGRGLRSSQVTRWKSSNKTIRDLELRYMFLGQIFANNTINDHKSLFEASKSVKKNRKMTVKSRNDVKSACFWHVLWYISAIFEDINLKLNTHIHETVPSNICYVFLKILIWGKLFRKWKKTFSFEIFKILKIRDSSFVALLVLRYFI